MKSFKTTSWIFLAASLAGAGAFAQCDPTSPGNFTDNRFDSGADCSNTGGVDENGGWNEPGSPFIEAGSRSPGDVFRVQGVVGTYNKLCDSGDDDSRDLDWIRFSATEACYITVSLQMNDAFGFVMDGTDVYDLLYIVQGSNSESGVTLYGAYGADGCPHVAEYMFPNGTKMARFPVPAGDVLIIVTTAFGTTYANPAQVHGPLHYGVDVSVTAYDHPACASSTNDCLATSSTGGCTDSVCCDLVCGLNPACCNVAWDASCVHDGIEMCANCISPCCFANPNIPNDCMSNAELVVSLPAFISFDCTDADTDGPNNTAQLCTSNTCHDLWYIVGPMPTAGELLVTMCGQGNIGDAVISLYDLGTSNDIGNPQDLPSKYVGCRDDVCDDNGDGSVDVDGPAGINLISVPAGEYILVRVGAFLNPAKSGNPGFPGTMEISFRTVFVDHGLQSVVLNNGVNTNLGIISGWSTAALPKRWSMVPFEMTTEGTIDGFDFAAFDSTTPNEIHYKIMARAPGASYGAFGRPFGDGNYVDGQIIASGSEPLDMSVFANVGDDYQQRFFIDITNPFHLDPGSYYFSIYGANSDGSGGGAFAWLLYGRKGMPQVTTAAVTISAEEAASSSSQGTFAAGTPFGWRSIGGGFPNGDPKFCFYNLGALYSVQPGDDPGLLYNCAFNLKGHIVDPACFGDLDGSSEVDGGDIGLVLLDFGPCPGCTTDLDGSGEVDGGDIGLVLLSFGACP
ncbi:MAG: hypothetical protein K8R92_05570 [Planctomycetes bacterium]|nr:hypothetical protein [Planctomycetota bacterium]